MASMAAGPVSVLQGLGFNERLYLAARFSKLLHVKLSEQDVAKLLLGWANSQSAGVDAGHGEIRRIVEGAESGG